MAEKKNTSFQGVQVAEVEADGEILTSSYDDMVGDLAFVRDIITGDDSSNYIRHDGAGRGARVGQPWVNQFWRAIRPSEGGFVFQDDKPGYYLGMWPVFAPYGETRCDVRVMTANTVKAPGVAAVVLNTSFVEQSRTNLEYVPSSGALKGTLTLTENTLQIVCLLTISDGQSNPGDYQIKSVSLTPGRIAGRLAPVAGSLTYRTDSDDGAKPFKVSTQTASSATVLNPVAIDTGQIAADRPIDAWSVAELAGTQNGLREYLTGMPVGWNLTHTLADSASRLAFYRGAGEKSGSNWTAGRRFAMPIYCESFGNMKTDGLLSAGEDGDGVGPFAVDAAHTYPCPQLITVGAITETTITRATLQLPEVPSAPSGTHVAVNGAMIVAAKTSGSVVITGKIATSTGSASSTYTPSSAGFGLIQITGAPYSQGDRQYVDFTFDADGNNKGVGDLYVVAAAMWLTQE